MNAVNNIGVIFGKYSPPHRGHLHAILNAGTQCERLYVVVSHHDGLDDSIYKNTATKPITMLQKLKWLSQELSDFDHIKVVGLDESKIPMSFYMKSEGWAEWSKLLVTAVPEYFDTIFFGEPDYESRLSAFFPDKSLVLFDRSYSPYPISATVIRSDPWKHWDYILGSAREHFVKKVLITGSESCAKSTLTKMLAKTFHTSWAREEGRYYASKYLGGREDVYKPEDFFFITQEQHVSDAHAVRTANKIAFFDTDAVVTQFYCNLYLGKGNPDIESMVHPDWYDLILFMKPDVPWVSDGQRWNSEDSVRCNLHSQLMRMYSTRGFKDIVELGGSYKERFNNAIALVRSRLNYIQL